METDQPVVFLFICMFHVQALMMEAESISETLVNIYQITQRNIPEDRHLHTRRRENPKPHLLNECR
jgi:hypothetical protein